MEKINIYIVGSCTAEDILDSNHDDKKENFIVDRFTGSISRSFSQPGKVAQRLLEDRAFHSYIPQLQPKLQRFINRQINLITKEKTALNLVKQAKPNSVFIIDAAYEMSPFYFKDYESFDLYHYYYIEKHFPQWFRQAVEENKFVFDSGIKEFAFQMRSNYKELLSLIEERNLTCIMMDNSLVRNVYDETTGTVGQIIPLYNKAFYRVFTHTEKNDPLQVFDYNQKMIDKSYKFLFDVVGDRYPIFKIPKDKVYCDLNHEFGYHPSHYHITCRRMLYQPLKDLIIDTYNKHIEKSKANIIY